jgi:hypothetical protein
MTSLFLLIKPGNGGPDPFPFHSIGYAGQTGHTADAGEPTQPELGSKIKGTDDGKLNLPRPRSPTGIDRLKR